MTTTTMNFAALLLAVAVPHSTLAFGVWRPRMVNASNSRLFSTIENEGKTTMEEVMARAKECAVSVGECSVDEIENLVSGKCVPAKLEPRKETCCRIGSQTCSLSLSDDVDALFIAKVIHQDRVKTMAIDKTFENARGPAFLRESVVEELALESDLNQQLSLLQQATPPSTLFVVDQDGTTTAATAAPTATASGDNDKTRVVAPLVLETATNNNDQDDDAVDVAFVPPVATASSILNGNDIIAQIMDQEILEVLTIAFVLSLLLIAPNHLL